MAEGGHGSETSGDIQCGQDPGYGLRHPSDVGQDHRGLRGPRGGWLASGSWLPMQEMLRVAIPTESSGDMLLLCQLVVRGRA